MPLCPPHTPNTIWVNGFVILNFGCAVLVSDIKKNTVQTQQQKTHITKIFLHIYMSFWPGVKHYMVESKCSGSRYLERKKNGSGSDHQETPGYGFDLKKHHDRVRLLDYQTKFGAGSGSDPSATDPGQTLWKRIWVRTYWKHTENGSNLYDWGAWLQLFTILPTEEFFLYWNPCLFFVRQIFKIVFRWMLPWFLY